MAITKGSLVLVPVALCFLLALQVEAQSLRDYYIIANGTVTCTNNATAELEGVRVDLYIRGYLVRGDYVETNDGDFEIRVREEQLGYNTRTNLEPDDFMVKIDETEEEEEKRCPSGKLQVAETFVRMYFGSGLYLGVGNLRNGTRIYFQETLQ